jgi:hypothetical protein
VGNDEVNYDGRYYYCGSVVALARFGHLLLQSEDDYYEHNFHLGYFQLVFESLGLETS